MSIERMTDLAGSPEAVIEHAPIHMHGPLPEIHAPRRTAAHRLERLTVEGLGFHWPANGNGTAGNFALHDICFAIERGEFVVVTGRIGSGKTTLLRTLLGLLTPETGTIRWNGRRIDDPASFFVPPSCAYTPQVPQLFSDTLEANIRMGSDVSIERLRESLRLAVMEDDVPQLQDGLRTLVGAKGVKLSGGQRQRTAAARMFVRDPEILVFDDLSSALDVETERLLWQRSFARGDQTYLVVSHRRPALERADRILLLQDGKLLGMGTLNALLSEHDEMRRLWQGSAGSQFGETDGGVG